MRKIIGSTSREAHEEMKPSNETIRGNVYSAIQIHGPCTAMELFQCMGKSKAGPQIRARLFELRSTGLVYEAGKAKCSVTGKKVILWAAS